MEKTKPYTERMLSDEKFKLVAEAQKKINRATGFSPSLKRLVNEILDQGAVDRATERLIEKLQD